MPGIALSTPDNTPHTSESLIGEKGLLVVFTCNHCPYAVAIWERLIKLSHYAKPLGIHTVAINPNIHPSYPADSASAMLDKIKEWSIPFPYLVDTTQSLAKSFDAQCTPDLYLLDKSESLVYHGRLDDNWQYPHQVKKEDLKKAIGALASGSPIQSDQHPARGCSIKWL